MTTDLDELEWDVRRALSVEADRAPIEALEWAGVMAMPAAPTSGPRRWPAITVAASVAAFGLGALSMIVAGPDPTRSVATSPPVASASTTPSPVETMPLPAESEIEPLALVPEAEWPDDVDTWSLGPVRPGSARVLATDDRTVLLARGIWRWDYAVEAADCVTTATTAEWDCVPVDERTPDVRHVYDGRDEGLVVAGLGADGTTIDDGSNAEPGTWVWLDVPSNTEVVGFTAAGATRWQRPIDGVAAFSQTAGTRGEFTALDADGALLAQRSVTSTRGASGTSMTWTIPTIDVPLVDEQDLLQVSLGVLPEFQACAESAPIELDPTRSEPSIGAVPGGSTSPTVEQREEVWDYCVGASNIESIGALDDLTGGYYELDPFDHVRAASVYTSTYVVEGDVADVPVHATTPEGPPVAVEVDGDVISRGPVTIVVVDPTFDFG